MLCKETCHALFIIIILYVNINISSLSFSPSLITGTFCNLMSCSKTPPFLLQESKNDDQEAEALYVVKF